MILFCFLAAFLPVAHAQVNDSSDLTDYTQDLLRLTRYSPLEGAGSHGSWGTELGLGAAVYDVRKSDLLEEQIAGDESRDLVNEESGQLTMQRLYVVKGFSFPLDLGMTFGKLMDVEVYETAANLQWTIYEDFRMPAVAVRGSFSRVFGLRSSWLNVTAADAITSMGFLRYFTVYAGYGLSRYEGEVDLSQDKVSRYLLQGDTAADAYSFGGMEWQRILAGMHIQVMPPFVNAVIEAQKTRNLPHSFLGKVSFGF